MHFPRTMFWVLLAAVSGIGFRTITAAEPAKKDTAAPSTADLEFFEKQVRPLLVAKCYECHSGSSKELKGSLRVDGRAPLLAGGDTGPAVVPGNAKQSLLIDAINYGDVYQMPPKSKMADAEIAVLTKWVNAGAPWPAEQAVEVANTKDFDLTQRKADHWAWRPITSPPVPAVGNTTWPRDDIDRFVLEKLIAHKFQPAGEANRRTLIRRLYFALIGLPPEPAAVDAFLADESPQAYEKIVDHLLESPHFGERWGRHWLDLVRYAESRGHEFDYDAPNAYQYRDYVIRALNANVPYDQFVREHIAGDLLPEPRTRPETKVNESILGTGFWFLGEWVHSPVDVRKDEADRYDNMIDVFSKTFLGMTVACARCHDHKFDAISQADYYAVAGFLQSSTYRQARFESMLPNEQLNQELSQVQASHRAALAPLAAERLRPVVDQLDDYLLAATELIREIAQAEQLPSDANSRNKVLTDFAPQLEQLTKKHHLDKSILRNWTNYLLDASLRDSSPLAVWFRLALRSEGDLSEMLTHVESLAKPTLSEILAEQNVVINYGDMQPHQWLVDGPKFGTGPLPAGSLMLSDKESVLPFTLTRQAAARRDAFWNGLTLAPGTQNDPGRTGQFVRAGSTIRTPTFTLDASHVHYLVRGAAFAYAEVDSHRVNQGPLHGSFIKKFDTKGELIWISHHLDRYRGHGMHLEFTPEGDQPFEIVAVVQADSAPAAAGTMAHSQLASRLKALKSNDLKRLAQETQQAFAASLMSLGSNQVRQPLDLELATYMVDHSELFAAEAPAAQAAVTAAVAAWKEEEAKLAPRRVLASHTALAMWEGNGVDEHLFIRGNHKTLGEEVPRRTLTALAAGESMKYGPGSGRLLLAEQLTSPENPLVSRVMVNRIWHHLFGHGLVRSVDNFGMLGQEPSHAELLDHLAVRFMREGWSVKGMIRAIVLSTTYRMESFSADPLATAADPGNRLLYRQNILRLEGEVIRDSLLAVSGRLDPAMYGPSVPIHLTDFLQGRGRPGSGPLDGNGRRSIYLSVRRNFLSPLMLAFDTPIPFTTVGKRNVSNVPAQALILLNDPMVAEQAQRWAGAALQSRPDTTARIELLYQQAFAHPPQEREVAAATAFLTGQGAEYQLTPEQAAGDLRVWTDLCHVLVNAKEFVFVR